MTTSHPLLNRSRQSGFTLIEIMIVVAIVAILSMVAYPSYRDYIMRGNIPSGTSALATKQVQMEQWFQDRRSYVGGDVAGGIGQNLGCVADTTGKYFDTSCLGGDAPTAPPTNTYRISAIGKGTMAGFTYTINQSGQRTTAAVPAGWAVPAPNTCWVTKKGGIC